MNPRFAMLAAMLAVACDDEPVAVEAPILPPHPEPRREPGVVVVHGRADWGRQPEPVFRPRGWRPCRAHLPKLPRDAEDRQAIAAAEAKRARKAKKRLSV